MFSRAIQWASNWDASHVAIELEGMVFHSDLLGPRCELLEKFEKRIDIVREIHIDSNLYDVVRLLHFFLKRNHKTYDFLLFISLGIYLLLKKLDNKPIFDLTGKRIPSNQVSKKVLHRISGAYLCTEFVGEFLKGNENKYTLPEEIWEEWKVRQ
jgi:hypothetical protein